MGSMVSRAARVTAFMLAAAFSGSMWAACVEGAASSTNAPMACCQDGELTCAAHGSSTDCCRTDGAPAATAAVAKAGIHPLNVAVVWAALPVPSISRVRFYRGVTLTFSRFDLGPPPYIAYSSLLI